MVAQPPRSRCAPRRAVERPAVALAAVALLLAVHGRAAGHACPELTALIERTAIPGPGGCADPLLPASGEIDFAPLDAALTEGCRAAVAAGDPETRRALQALAHPPAGGRCTFESGRTAQRALCRLRPAWATADDLLAPLMNDRIPRLRAECAVALAESDDPAAGVRLDGYLARSWPFEPEVIGTLFELGPIATPRTRAHLVPLLRRALASPSVGPIESEQSQIGRALCPPGARRDDEAEALCGALRPVVAENTERYERATAKTELDERRARRARWIGIGVGVTVPTLVLGAGAMALSGIYRDEEAARWTSTISCGLGATALGVAALAALCRKGRCGFTGAGLLLLLPAVLGVVTAVLVDRVVPNGWPRFASTTTGAAITAGTVIGLTWALALGD